MKNFKWYDWAMLTALVAGLLVGFAFSPWGRSILQSDAAPAWVQAVGSIAAIVALFQGARVQARMQFRHALRMERRAEKQRRRALTAVVKVAVDYGVAITEFASKRPPRFAFVKSWEWVTGQAIEASIRALDALPMHEIGDPEFVINAAGIRGSLANIHGQAMEIASNTGLEVDMQRYIECLKEIEDIGRIMVAYTAKFKTTD